MSHERNECCDRLRRRQRRSQSRERSFRVRVRVELQPELRYLGDLRCLQECLFVILVRWRVVAIPVGGGGRQGQTQEC